jgi:hypothetical protein
MLSRSYPSCILGDRSRVFSYDGGVFSKRRSNAVIAPFVIALCGFFIQHYTGFHA